MLMWCLEEPISQEDDQGQDSIDRFDLVMLMWSLENPASLEEGQGHPSIGRIVCSGEVRVGSCQRIPIDGRSYPWVGSVYLTSCFSEDDRTLWLSSFLGKDYGRYGTGRWAWLRFWFKSEGQEVGFYPFSCCEKNEETVRKSAICKTNRTNYATYVNFNTFSLRLWQQHRMTFCWWNWESLQLLHVFNIVTSHNKIHYNNIFSTDYGIEQYHQGHPLNDLFSDQI